MNYKQKLVLCTCPDQQTGIRIAEALVNAQLAACINIVPGLTSVYRWQGKLETGTEILLLIKTTEAAYPQLEARIRELHPYELPEIIAVGIEAGLDAYRRWIEDCCQVK